MGHPRLSAEILLAIITLIISLVSLANYLLHCIHKLFKVLCMSSGRPKGQKNKLGHSAGGARAGSGRKKNPVPLAPSHDTEAVQPGKLFKFVPG